MTKSELRQIIKQEIQALPWDKIIRAEVEAMFREMFGQQSKPKQKQQESYQQRPQPKFAPQQRVVQPQQQRPQKQVVRKMSNNPMLNDILNETANTPFNLENGTGNPLLGHNQHYTPQPQYVTENLQQPVINGADYVDETDTNMFVKDYGAILKRSLELSNKA